MEKLAVKQTKWIVLPTIRDGYDGILSVAEQNHDFPFTIKRVYYIYNLMNHESVLRGKHAHRELHQVLFCINGSCNILLDDGVQQQEIQLALPHVGIYLGTNLWHTMHNFTNNCILLVFASDYFEESDYIRDYNEFLLYMKSQK